MTRFIIFLLSLFPAVLCAEGVISSSLPQNYVFLGDSMTWLGGDDCDQPRGWTSHFARGLAEGTCKSYARSGATMSNSVLTKKNLTENVGIISDCNTIYNQIFRLREAIESGHQPVPDVIIVGAGANDAWFIKKRPAALKMTASEAMEIDSDELLSGPEKALSIASAVRQTVLLLRQTAPDVQIILLAPNQSASVPADRLKKAAEIIEECGDALNVPVIRQDLEGPISASEEKLKKRLTYDGTHTSESGGEALGNFLLEKVSQIIGKDIKRK